MGEDAADSLAIGDLGGESTVGGVMSLFPLLLFPVARSDVLLLLLVCTRSALYIWVRRVCEFLVWLRVF